jgi:uncharacterized Zn finger protein
MYGWGWRPYVPVAQRRKNGEKAAQKLIKKGEKIEPIKINGRTIAKSFWGKAWCEHLESFSDFANRLPRGRTYVRNGSVIHLKIEEGKVTAFVQGSDLYKIAVEIKSLGTKKWKAISEGCSGEVGSVIELMQGKLSDEVMKTITDRHDGLFPKPKEISLKCSCPDSAYLCKHLAAVMYGIGSRLDNEPELLFRLRNVDHMELISKATIKTSGKGARKSKSLDGQDLSNLFNIDLDDAPVGIITDTNKDTDKSSGKSLKKLKAASSGSNRKPRIKSLKGKKAASSIKATAKAKSKTKKV